jgi:tetratricopeptide (TPR) repeat protein
MPSPVTFLLDIATEPGARRAVLRLSRHEGPFVAAHEVDLARHPASSWHGLFDLRRHVQTHRRVMPAKEQIAALGRFLGEKVLGPAIAGALAEGIAHRTLMVRLSSDPDDTLAAAFARVPWEIAIAPRDARTLWGRNVVVRVTLEGAEPKNEATIAPSAMDPLRVLLVFADAPEQRPLAARLERERLLDLFFDEVMPSHDVEVDVLCHGVTRRRIVDRVRERGGYHLVHWSGHGHVNHLEVAAEHGEEPWISGEELVGLLTGAGGLIPPVVFLGACYSGSMITAKDWSSLRASLEEEARESTRDTALKQVLAEQPGFSGTALSLLRAGVKQVVAMRYEVGDGYARRLARRVYRGMLADRAHHPVDAAVALARGDLARDEKRAAEHNAVDHATPLVLGSESVRLLPAVKKSKQYGKREPRPAPLTASRELDRPRSFVGRGKELTRLRNEWLEAGETPVALIQGLAGLGKTTLAAEAVSLWFGQFDAVLAFQAKGGMLTAEAFLQRLDERLVVTSDVYRERCRDKHLVRVYLAPGTEGLSQHVREELLQNNLVDLLGVERILLVLDNFETNLLGSGQCHDRLWDRLLESFTQRLVGTGSRVLVTSRHKPAALRSRALWIPLGPLPRREAALLFQGQAPLRELWYGDDAAGWALAQRILDVSRGHPLILGRIADLARGYHDKAHGLPPAGRQAIAAALDRIEGDGFKALPDVFAEVRSDEERAAEHAYLTDVAVGAVDLLIERSSAGARTLLWIVTRVGEPPAEDVIRAVVGSDPAQHLRELCATGLLVREAGSSSYAFHELVAERAAAWMERHPGERGGRTEAEIWKAYGERYGAAFQALRASGQRDAALEAGRRGIRYLVRARAFESMGTFAGGMITSTSDPSLLGPVIADLQAAAGEVPAGEARWTLRTNLADGLSKAGRPDQALSFYVLAVEEAEAAKHWSDVGRICQNWANTLRDLGQLDRARETFLRSASAERRAGNPRVNIIGSELEALRIDVMQGRAEEALPAVEESVAEVRGFWDRRAKGERVREAPDDEALARTFVGGLDIAEDASRALERWQACLDLLAEIEQVKRAVGASEHEQARARFNTHFPLLRLGRVAEAKAVLAGCLDTFRRADDVTSEATALSALADVWNHLGDSHHAAAVERRALALRERLPDPENRASSHGNLAGYLHAIGSPAEAGAHDLANLVYTLATGLDLHLPLRNLDNRIRQSAARDEHYDLPRLTDILSTPAFAPLRTFLADRNISADDLQSRIDALLAHIPSPTNPPP